MLAASWCVWLKLNLRNSTFLCIIVAIWNIHTDCLHYRWWAIRPKYDKKCVECVLHILEVNTRLADRSIKQGECIKVKIFSSFLYHQFRGHFDQEHTWYLSLASVVSGGASVNFFERGNIFTINAKSTPDSEPLYKLYYTVCFSPTKCVILHTVCDFKHSV